MIITDCHLSGTAFGPYKNDPPLVIDADGVGAGKIALQSLQAIARRDGEIHQSAGSIHLNEFTESDPGDRSMATIALRAEEVFGIVIGKRLNHALFGFMTTSQVTSSMSSADVVVSEAKGSRPSRPLTGSSRKGGRL